MYLIFGVLRAQSRVDIEGGAEETLESGSEMGEGVERGGEEAEEASEYIQVEKA